MAADGLYSRVSSERQTGENQLPAAPAVLVALYTRVSTSDQNCEFQLRELQDYAAHQGWQVVEVYQDTMSGAQARRPGLTRLMDDAAARKFHCVMKHANEAVEEVRRAEFFRKGGRMRGLVKGKRWLLLTRWVNLTSGRRRDLNALFAMNRRLMKAYLLKGELAVSKANAVTLVLVAATNYRGGDPAAGCTRYLLRAAKPFTLLRSAHVADHQRLFNRAELDLRGSGPRTCPRFLPMSVWRACARARPTLTWQRCTSNLAATS
jgi:hypothetical protein